MIRFEALMQPVWQNLVFALLHTLWQGASTTINPRFPTPVVRAGDGAPITVIAEPVE